MRNFAKYLSILLALLTLSFYSCQKEEMPNNTDFVVDFPISNQNVNVPTNNGNNNQIETGQIYPDWWIWPVSTFTPYDIDPTEANKFCTYMLDANIYEVYVVEISLNSNCKNRFRIAKRPKMFGNKNDIAVAWDFFTGQHDFRSVYMYYDDLLGFYEDINKIIYCDSEHSFITNDSIKKHCIVDKYANQYSNIYYRVFFGYEKTLSYYGYVDGHFDYTKDPYCRIISRQDLKSTMQYILQLYNN